MKYFLLKRLVYDCIDSWTGVPYVFSLKGMGLMLNGKTPPKEYEPKWWCRKWWDATMVMWPLDIWLDQNPDTWFHIQAAGSSGMLRIQCSPHHSWPNFLALDHHPDMKFLKAGGALAISCGRFEENMGIEIDLNHFSTNRSNLGWVNPPIAVTEVVLRTPVRAADRNMRD
jgi:hypothetical protein